MVEAGTEKKLTPEMIKQLDVERESFGEPWIRNPKSCFREKTQLPVETLVIDPLVGLELVN